MSEKYDKNLVEKYLKDLKKAYPDTDSVSYTHLTLPTILRV